MNGNDVVKMRCPSTTGIAGSSPAVVINGSLEKPCCYCEQSEAIMKIRKTIGSEEIRCVMGTAQIRIIAIGSVSGYH